MSWFTGHRKEDGKQICPQSHSLSIPMHQFVTLAEVVADTQRRGVWILLIHHVSDDKQLLQICLSKQVQGTCRRGLYFIFVCLP